MSFWQREMHRFDRHHRKQTPGAAEWRWDRWLARAERRHRNKTHQPRRPLLHNGRKGRG